MADYTVTFNNTQDEEGVRIYVYSDSERTTQVGDDLYTDVNGQATIPLADGTYYYTSYKGGYHPYESSFTVSGAALTEDFTLSESTTFRTMWRTTSDNQTVTLPLESDGTYNFTVDWGDESEPENITTDSASHEYATAGDYTIEITGQIEGWRFNYSGDTEVIREVNDWGPLILGDNGGYFYGCENLRIFADDVLDVTGVTNMEEAFRLCESIVNAPNMGKWDVSNVTTMKGMFRYCCDFNQDITDWDTSSVTTMEDMFREYRIYKDPSFNQPIGVWDVSNVESMRSMFRGSLEGQSSFNQPLNNWDVSSVKDMSYMFYAANVFNQDLNGWDVSSVTHMARMFAFAANFNGDITNWDVSSVIDMERMFSSAVAFNQPIGGWDVRNVEVVTHSSFLGLFARAYSFNQPLNDWELESVAGGELESMFAWAESFNQPLEDWDMGSIKNTRDMFNGATAYEQSVAGWDISSVNDMRGMFKGATLLTSNYNETLISWAAQPVQSDVIADFGNSKYTVGAAEDARQKLIDENNWTILDAGPTYEHDSPSNLMSENVGWQSFDVAWDAVATEGDGYDLELFKNDNQIVGVHLFGTSYTFEDLDWDSEYTWRVRTRQSGDYATSSWSSETVTTEPQPTLSTPANLGTSQITQNSFTAVCDPVSNAEEYRWQLFADEAMSEQIGYDKVTTSPEYTFESLDHETLYYWRVRAEENWPYLASTYADHDTLTAALPQLEKPGNLRNTYITFDGFTANWDSVTDAELYRVQIFDNDGFTGDAMEEGLLDSLSRQFGGLSEGTKYWWRARAEADSYSASNWSEWSVNIQEEKPPVLPEVRKFYWDRLWYEVRQLVGYLNIQDLHEWNRLETIIEGGIRNFYYPPPSTHSYGHAHIWSFLWPETTDNLTIGQETFSLPVGASSIGGQIMISDSGGYSPVRMVTQSRYRSLKVRDNDGKPMYFCVEANEKGNLQAKFYPTPDDNYEIVFRYERAPQIELEIKQEGTAVVNVDGNEISLYESGAFSSTLRGDRIRLSGNDIGSGNVLLVSVTKRNSDDEVVIEKQDLSAELSADDSVEYQVYKEPEILGGRQHEETILASCLAFAEKLVDERPGQHWRWFAEVELPKSINRDKSLNKPTIISDDPTTKAREYYSDWDLRWQNTEL